MHTSNIVSIKKYFTIISPGKLVSIGIMVFLLSFLTVGNAFLYGGSNADQTTAAANATTDDDDDCSKRPISSEEEKSSRSVSNTLTEEYLHHHDLFTHLYISVVPSHHQYIHPHGFGDDHSTLDCPPPDNA